MDSARLFIQCTFHDNVGTFLKYDSGNLASPIFPDLVALSQWCNLNGWTPMPYDGTPIVTYQNINQN